jgi:uncharacterized SAM-binding protein YcdF (DUF218 family)
MSTDVGDTGPGRGTGRLARATGLLAVFGFVAVAFTPLANVLHNRFVVPAEIGPADAIVVLGAGASFDYLTERSLRRAVHGIRLYQARLAPVLVLQGSRDDSEGATRAALARDLAVPDKAVVLEGARTTREEAEQSWRRLSPEGRTRILLVTGAHHMWRARALFEREGFEVLAAPVDEVPPRGGRPELRLSLARSLLQEGMARLVYRLAGVV